MNTNTNQQGAITETFIKKILAHLDNTDVNKLQEFLNLFAQPPIAKIIYNSTPFPDATQFLTLWQQQVVATQHTLTSVDYHIIPGSGTLICNINCKVRFDESGKDKNGQDAVIRQGTQNNNNSNANRRHIWGPYFGVSLQLVLADTIYSNQFQGVIQTFNYTVVYKPQDSLMEM
ncbi:mRNA transport regulator Mtr2p [Monosporozyma unispora]|nr:hypothetical protein C6P44_001753 [Kazachstania unispora]